ncbi:hypothetical protein ACFYWN_11225 [Streptomyces sp. NPDC002917]|uniref:hypothetical protein n=1 Tax=unclassified Streptomyces TaxID=2593676 RepID=UPI002E802B25|nr:hypothetical protein [Streptomyces sp. NBC_00562]WTD35198.1 hypothetical protein OHB03_24905 [Streptomyces sp. NBC_01643]WUC21581.1 hypothetical protein OHA33_23500 [Streptomyces sp. NBC_00562]
MTRASPLRLVKEPSTATAGPAPSSATNRDRVRQAVQDGARTLRDITDRTGINTGTVSREIRALMSAGALRESDDGMVLPRRRQAA